MSLNKLSSFFDKSLLFFTSIAGVLVISLMLLVSMEVVLRYFFGKPTSWVVEVSEYILLFIPFLVGAWVLREEGHVKMDMLLIQLSKKNRALVIAITSFFSALICGILTVFGVKTALYFYSVGYKTPTVLKLPKSALISIIFFGMFLLFIQLTRRGYSHLKEWKRLRASSEKR